MRPAILATLLTSFVFALGVAGYAAIETVEKIYGMFIAVTSMIPTY